MDIGEIQLRIQQGKYEISFHAEKERYAEEISIPDIISAITSEEILEDYPDDPRGPSCLIMGHSEGKPIHIVCGLAPNEEVD